MGIGNSLLLLTIAVYFLFSPIAIVIKDLADPGLHDGRIPEFTYRWHKKVSDDFAAWARERVESNRATSLDINDISGTEWPMFSAVYFLWATEELQRSWLRDHTVSDQPPIDYAENAIRAAASLITDKGNAAWVIKHWGDEYLERENLFYRMLLISGLTSFENLLGDTTYRDLLRNQVQSLADELDSSSYGLLDDYPGEAYSVDILPAVVTIARAGKTLNLDYSQFTERSLRGFSGERLDLVTHLPAYIVDSNSGNGYGPARGVGISYMLIWATEVWPKVSQDWYGKYEEHFWQKGWFMSGVREFSVKSGEPSWLVDVDSGPVIAGYGTAASAFGIGAARVNGRLDHAYSLGAEALAASWPLPNGTLLLPRLLSNLSDAPFVGETALLFTFTRQPITKDLITPSTFKLPVFVYLILLLYFLIGMMFARKAYRWLKALKGDRAALQFRWRHLQVTAWTCIAVCGCVALVMSEILICVACVLLMLCFPFRHNSP